MSTVRHAFAARILLAAFCASALGTLPSCRWHKKDDEESTEPERTSKTKSKSKKDEPAAETGRTITPKARGEGKASYVWIDKIVLTSESTTLSMRITNDTKERLDGLHAAPPKDPDAFYIMRRSDKKRFALRSVSGDLAVKPNQTTLQPDQSVTFTLVFEPLDKGMTELDLIEGANQTAGSTYWNFKGVKLQ